MMADKPSYKELEKRVKVLEAEAGELKRAMDSMQESEEYYCRLVDTMNDGVCIQDKDGKIIYISDNACDMLGYSKDEFIGHAAIDFLDDANQKILQKEIARRRKGKGGRYELEATRKDGQKLRLLMSAQPIFDDQGRYKGSFGVFTDITDRKRMEEQVITAKARLEHLLIVSPAVIYTCEPGGDYPATFISENVKTQLDYEPDEFMKPKFWIEHIHPEDKVRIIDQLQGLFEGGYHIHEYRFRHKDGTYRWMRDEMRLVRDAKGKPLEIVGYWVDITDRKNAENKLAESEAVLKIQADELKEVNSALRVLLKQRDKDKAELEEKVFLNVRELVMPHVEKLKKMISDAKQKAYLNILESNLNEIVSPFAHRLSMKYSALTPTEIQMAFLIRDGKTTKEIADLLNLSHRTVESHRQSIRMKMGIRNRRANLRSHLLSV
ncbi:MAG: PAS domain S-box protein [Desulfobacterales bacterium]|nr:MAG: PAS domain S-box protein [Desulfobacterales bacterium]